MCLRFGGLLCFLGFHTWVEFNGYPLASGVWLEEDCRICLCCPRFEIKVDGHWHKSVDWDV
jgi:hypothetical protein